GKVREEVERLVLPILGEEGMELVDIEYKTGRGRGILRLYIDKPGGVKIDDCERVSKRIEPVLDRSNIIGGHYFLEVSSPGLDRPLKKEKDFKRFMGRLIKVKTFSPIDNQKTFVGTLKDYKEEVVTLETREEKVIEIPMKNIAKANLHE
ncbi:ribosome maturation factor RimP, partial [bacterium]|nr:ribosome maturation factor RimP [bacterium]